MDRERLKGNLDLLLLSVLSGLLASTWAQAEGRRRRVYGLTDQGVAALAAQQTEWRRFAGGVHAALGWAAQAVWPPAGGLAAAEPGWSA